MARVIYMTPREHITKCDVCGRAIIYDSMTDLRIIGGFDNFTPTRRVITCPNCHHVTGVNWII